MLPEPIQRTAAAPVSDAIDHYAGLLGKQGWCIIPDATPVETVAALDADVAQAFDETPFCEGGFYGRRTKRFGRLLARSPQRVRRRYESRPRISADDTDIRKLRVTDDDIDVPGFLKE